MDSNKKFRFTDKLEINSSNLINIISMLFIASIILIPVDNLPYMSSIMGELGNRGAVYPFIFILPLILVLLLKNKQIYINKTNEAKILFVFFMWVLLSSVINLPFIQDSIFKGRSGISKIVVQMMLLIFMYAIAYATEVIIQLKKLTLQDYRRYIAYSTIPVFIYGTIELLNFLGIFDFSDILKGLSYMFQTYHRGEVYTKGIRTICGEVSYFAMYSSFVIPWIVSYIFTEKGFLKKLIYSGMSGYLLILLIFSKSRTAYAIIFAQIALFTLFILVAKVNKKIKVNIIQGILVLLLGFSVLNNTVLSKVGGDSNSMQKISVQGLINSIMDSNNMSNIARFGLQKAAVDIGIGSPVFGVGLGQYGFNVEDNLSPKALTSNEVQRWISEDEDVREYWPPAFALYPRIIAEQGVIGLIIWVTLLGYIIIKAILTLRKKENDFMGIALIVSFIGILIVWFNADTYAQVPFWITLPFIIRYNNSDLIEDKQ